MFIGIIIVFTIAVMWYLAYHSSKVARDFCGSVDLNDDIGVLDQRAKAGQINHTSSNDEGTEEHQFWVYGIFESMSMCKVRVVKGKVVSKKVFDDG